MITDATTGLYQMQFSGQLGYHFWNRGLHLIQRVPEYRQITTMEIYARVRAHSLRRAVGRC